MAGAHREGVVIAWKRDVFNLFRSGEMELNRCAKEGAREMQLVERGFSLVDAWHDGETIGLGNRMTAISLFQCSESARMTLGIQHLYLFLRVHCGTTANASPAFKENSSDGRRPSFFRVSTHVRARERLGEHEEDRALAGKVATSDNVALLTLLQPWQDSTHPSGACVVCTQLCDDQGPSGEAVRSLQACSLTRTIEAFNSDFHLPVILCGTMNCVPSSRTYEILCNGRVPRDPVRPGAPGKPEVQLISTSTALLRWTVPPVDSQSLSPAAHLYKLIWVPGGSRFLGGEVLDVREADCLVYDFVENAKGHLRSEQNPFRSFVVGGLSSGIAYEFRVAAVNTFGQGPWSERSEAIRMPYMVGNDPEDRVLLGAASIKLVRNRELREARQMAQERLANPRSYEVRKLIKIDELRDPHTDNMHPFDSVSGMTPRFSDSVLHPDSANVRTDTGYPILELVSCKAPRDRDGATTGRRRRLRARRDVPDGSVGNSDGRTRSTQDGDSRSTAGRDDEAESKENLKQRDWPHKHVSTESQATEGGPKFAADDNRAATMDGCCSADCSLLAGGCPRRLTKEQESASGPERDLSVLLRMATLEVDGARSDRQKHALGLRSAYKTHSSAGEPTFTVLSDHISGTVDYIFFSEECLLPAQVLSLPEMEGLLTRDEHSTELSATPACRPPRVWQLDPQEDGYMGEWAPSLTENPLKTRHQIPNKLFPSNHLMLMADLIFFESRCASTWC